MNKNKLIIVLLLSSNVFAQTNNETVGGAGNYWCDDLTPGVFGFDCPGLGAGGSLTSGDRNVFIGDNAGMSVSSGSYNTFVGESAGLSQTTAQDNTFIGYQAGFSVTTGTDNTFIGERAGFSNTATDNTFIGSKAGYYNTSGLDNTFIGEQAGYFSTTGDDNTFIGEDAGYSNTTGEDNTAVGSTALRMNTTGRANTMLGVEAGYDISTSYNNTAVGAWAGTDIGVGMCNTMLGSLAGTNTEHADFNTFVGFQAGWDNNRTNSTSNANSNTYLGFATGVTNREGSNNVLLGAFTDFSNLDENTGATACTNSTFWNGEIPSRTGTDNNVSDAVAVGASIRITGDDAIAIGYSVVATANNIIAIGSGATGTHNGSIVVGQGASSKANNTVVIGNDSTVGWTPNIDAVTALGNTTYRFSDVLSNKLSVNALTTTAAEIDLFADAGTADDDKWTISAADGGEFSISTFATGVDVNVFSIANTGDAVIAGDLALNSDRRLKANINPIENALDIVGKLEGNTYHWKDKNRSPGEHIGFIAQEVEQVLPNLVSSDKAGIKSVNYQGVVPVLVNAINELNEQAEKQQQTILQMQALLEQQQALIIKLSNKQK